VFVLRVVDYLPTAVIEVKNQNVSMLSLQKETNHSLRVQSARYSIARSFNHAHTSNGFSVSGVV
jgi:hypothetical protein